MEVPPIDHAVEPRSTRVATELPEDSTLRARRWRLLGLLLWWVVVPIMLPRAIWAGNEWLNDFGGAFASVNFPGPKVWAVPLLQRSLGGSPAEMGTSITVYAIVNVMAIWLLTMPASRQPSTLAFAARWVTVLGCGALVGMLLHAGTIRSAWSTRTDSFALIALGTELAGTTLTYLWLAEEAWRLQRRALARQLFLVAFAVAILIALAFPATIAHEYFERRADNLPLQIAGAIYGVMVIAVAAMAGTFLLRLMPPLYRAAFPRGLGDTLNLEYQLATEPLCGECGYDLRGSSTGAPCPECGGRAVINLDHDDARMHETHWARFVIAGLIAWLLLAPENLYVILAMDFNQLFGGTTTMVNFAGPKAWGVSALQRVVGNEPRTLGSNGAVYMVLNLAAIWCITWPHAATMLNEKWNALRKLARWSAILGGGAFLGFTLLGRNVLPYDSGFWKWIFVAVLSAELTGTVFVYLYLAKLSIGRLPPRVRRVSLVTAIIAATLMLLALVILPLGEPFAGLNQHLLVKAFFGVYGAVGVAGGMLGAAVALRLIAALFPIAAPRRLILLRRRGSDATAADTVAHNLTGAAANEPA